MVPSPGQMAAAVLGLGAALLVASCASDPLGSSDLKIRVEGRLERSLTVRAILLENGSEVPQGEVAWSVEPASAAEVRSAGEVHLLEAGRLILRAWTDERVVRRELTVAEPPTILFDMKSEQGAAREIYAVDLDGRNLERLTDHPATDADPTSGDGRVVFVSFRDGNGELYRLQASEEGPMRLTDTPEDEAQPALSRGGGRLAFTRQTGGIAKVWAKDPAGPGAERLTEGSDHGDGIEASPTWAPGADSLAFMSTDAGDADLYRWSPAGVTPIAVRDGPELEPAWSPDGTRLVFAAARRGGDANLTVRELATGAETELTDAPINEGQPAWVGEDRVVYTAFTGSGSELRWLELESPEESRRIRVPGVDPEHPTVWR